MNEGCWGGLWKGHAEQQKVRIKLVLMILVTFQHFFQKLEGACCYVEGCCRLVASDVAIKIRNLTINDYTILAACRRDYSTPWALR